MKKILFILLVLSSCTNSSNSGNSTAITNESIKEHFQAVDNVRDGIMHVEVYQGDVESFRLVLGKTILYYDNTVTHSLGAELIEKKTAPTKGWLLNGFTEKDGSFIYKFKKK